MNARTLFILVLIAASLGLAALMVSRNQDQSPSSGELFLPGLQDALNQIDRIVVTGAGGKTIATLQRGSDRWTLAERDGYPANLGRIRQNLINLAEARVLETKTANPDFYSRLGVEDVSADSARGTQLELTSPGFTATVILGQTGVNGSNAYVRRAGEAQSYLVRANLDPGPEQRDWLDDRVCDIASSRISSVRIVQTDGEVLEIFKTSAESTDFQLRDQPAGRSLSYPGVANAIGAALAALNFDDVAAADSIDTSGLQAVTAIFETFDGLRVTAKSWPAPDGQRLSFSAEAIAQPEAAGSNVTTAPEPDGRADAAATAERLNAVWSGWIYTLPGYKAEPFTRRMADLLAPAN
jgi:hypothetical protein